ncbi:hypothetical protein DFJ73DRAFT_661456 [Zopfochytrium polystomum]|nr:hypothetical protein DFJ73DRAFT_661456 [Zopfochytrium polystomum]
MTTFYTGPASQADPARQQPMEDMARERRSSAEVFSSVDMQILLDGGIERFNARNAAYQLIRRDPHMTFGAGHPFDLTRKEMREKTMIQVRRYIEVSRTLKEPLLKRLYVECMAELSESFSMRLYVHDMLYRTSITLFGTEAQKAKFLPDVDDYNVFGCFAMTELGHSSSLRDLETTATFDQETKEWVINSPTLTSTKWWIGMAGQTATHTVMVCQTIVNGENIGLNWVIVPLRDPKTGRLVPGITAGDIGSKAGRQGLDNGWIQASNARVPLDHLLMKWTQVEPNGDVTPPPHPAIVYATLIPERITSVSAIRVLLGQSVTIAARYGVVRRQGPVNQQIIDYQSQHVNLLPIVAGLYVYSFVEKHLYARWDGLQELSVKDPMAYVAQLPDIHSVSAGIKAVAMWWLADSLELCRRACGGHAYSAYNAIAGHLGDMGVLTTGGGDNFPMAQQLSRYVLGCVERGLKGKKNDGESAQFLNKASTYASKSSFAAKSDADYENLHTYLELFAVLTVKLSSRLSAKLSVGGKAAQEDNWNNNMVDLIQLSKLYTFYNVFETFAASLAKLKGTPSEKLVPVILKCGVLFAADLARRDAVEVGLEEGFMTGDQARAVRSTVYRLAKELRAVVVGLTDALGFPDFILKAPIGRADGDIYNAYFDVVTKAPDCFQVPYFEKEIRPILVKGKL